MKILFVGLVALSVLCLAPVFVIAKQEKLSYVIHFTDYETGLVEDWLQRKGFEFKHDAQRRNLIDLNVSDNGLVIEAKRHAFGMILNEAVNVRDFSSVEIDWGVNQFPQGASYEQGVRNEALMVFIFLGDERKSSGSLLIPDSPYFIALFLCHGDDKINHAYVGAYFKKSGRYVCLDRPATGKMLTTRFNLLEAYRSYYDKELDDDPAVTGLALGLDTKKAGAGGRASAFIKEIRFYN